MRLLSILPSLFLCLAACASAPDGTAPEDPIAGIGGGLYDVEAPPAATGGLGTGGTPAAILEATGGLAEAPPAGTGGLGVEEPIEATGGLGTGGLGIGTGGILVLATGGAIEATGGAAGMPPTGTGGLGTGGADEAIGGAAGGLPELTGGAAGAAPLEPDADCLRFVEDNGGECAETVPGRSVCTAPPRCETDAGEISCELEPECHWRDESCRWFRADRLCVTTATEHHWETTWREITCGPAQTRPDEYRCSDATNVYLDGDTGGPGDLYRGAQVWHYDGQSWLNAGMSNEVGLIDPSGRISGACFEIEDIDEPGAAVVDVATACLAQAGLTLD